MKTALRLVVFAAALLVGTGVSSLSGGGPVPPSPFPSNPGLIA